MGMAKMYRQTLTYDLLLFDLFLDLDHSHRSLSFGTNMGSTTGSHM